MRIAVLGSGSWGTALTILLARNGHEVVLAGRDPEELGHMRGRRENLRYLPGFAIPQGVTFEYFKDVEGEFDLSVVAIPSSSVRSVLESVSTGHRSLVLATKGLEPISGKLMIEVASEVKPTARLAVLSGPNLAIEIVRGIPTAAVAGLDQGSPEAEDRVAPCLPRAFFLANAPETFDEFLLVPQVKGGDDA